MCFTILLDSFMHKSITLREHSWNQCAMAVLQFNARIISIKLTFLKLLFRVQTHKMHIACVIVTQPKHNSGSQMQSGFYYSASPVWCMTAHSIQRSVMRCAKNGNFINAVPGVIKQSLKWKLNSRPQHFDCAFNIKFKEK